MSCKSVDQLQKTLTDSVFGYAQDSKKAAGRALGTIVEIITFYLLESWGLSSAISIETRVPEFGRLEVTHNVEYSLHPVLTTYDFSVVSNKSLTANRVLRSDTSPTAFREFERTNNYLCKRYG